jgi:hypothetical protein
MSNNWGMSDSSEIVAEYVSSILDKKFIVEDSKILDAIFGLGNEDSGLERYFLVNLLTPIVAAIWEKFQPMRFFLNDPWTEWERYLRLKLK